MGTTLDALQKLQEIELQLTEIRQRVAARQRAVRAQEKRIAALHTELEAKRGALRIKQMEADRLGVDVKAADDRIAKLRVQLNSAKTNKEYSALLAQINTDKADTAKTEDRILALMTEIDAARKTHADDEQRLAVEQSKLADVQRAAADYEAQVSGRLATLTHERASAAAAVPASALAAFDRVAERHEGQALALVIRTNPRREEFACNGCNMSLTIEQVNSIVARDEPVYCHTCGRILYLDRSFAAPAR